MTTPDDSASTRIGRYSLYPAIASGGMATVHFGRLRGSGGFSRTVAIKRLHDNYVNEPEFVARFLDEARLAARIRHPNVVPTLDVVSRGSELFLVMEYVHGEALGKLITKSTTSGQKVPLRIASAIMTSMLQGLHDAHEARSESGEPLRIVHRDVSPQNVIVGVDGVTRILDFGIAKAVDRAQSTKDGTLRGKVAYMSPEQLLDAGVDRLTDIYAASVVFWELVTGSRIYGDADVGLIAARVMNGASPPLPSTRRDDLPGELEALIMSGLARDSARRPQTAREMALEIERIVEPASAARVAEWVKSLAQSALDQRAKLVSDIENGTIAPERFDSPELDEEPTQEGTPIALPKSIRPLSTSEPPKSEPHAADAAVSADAQPAPPYRLPLVLIALLSISAIVAMIIALDMLAHMRRSDTNAVTQSPPATPSIAVTQIASPPSAPPPQTAIELAPDTQPASNGSKSHHVQHTHVSAVESAAPSTAPSAAPPTPTTEPSDSLYRTRR